MEDIKDFIKRHYEFWIGFDIGLIIGILIGIYKVIG